MDSAFISQKCLLVYYGKDLLKSSIEAHNIKLIETLFDITLECFKEDPKHNHHILSIICENMRFLDENYSDFLEKYSNEMNLFMDHSHSDIIHDNFRHLHSFCYELKVTKNNFINQLVNVIGNFFQLFWKLCVALFISILLLIMVWKFGDLLSKKSIIASIIIASLSAVFILVIFFSIIPALPKAKPMLRFVVPFPGYMTYPKNYKWYKELFQPQPSSFSQSQNSEIYKTWNGEAMINFKWRVFGRYYYAIIWIFFVIYLVSFTLASIPSDIINGENRKKLFMASIILGLIHLSFELRKFFYNWK